MENLNLVETTFFVQSIKMGQLLSKTFFPDKINHIQLSCCLKHFRANSLKTSHFNPKRDYLRKEHRNTQKVCFS